MYRVLVGRREGRSPCGGPSHRYVGIINTDHKEIRWEVINRMYVVLHKEMWQTRLNMVTNFWVL
jgi:hypothetical protein